MQRGAIIIKPQLMKHKRIRNRLNRNLFLQAQCMENSYTNKRRNLTTVLEDALKK